MRNPKAGTAVVRDGDEIAMAGLYAL